MKAVWLVTIFYFCGLAFLQAEAREDAREAALRYEEAFALAGSLPRDPEEFVRNATREDVAKLERALDLLRENVGAKAVDWGVDWKQEGISGAFEQLGQARGIVRLGVAYHEEKLKRGVHDRFVGDMAALLRAGRLLAEEQLLVHFLTSLAMEGIVGEAVARNATKLPPEVRAEMMQVWRATPPAPTMVEVLKSERLWMRGELFANDPTVDELLENTGGDKEKAFEEFLAVHKAEMARIIPFLTTSYADLPELEEIAEGLSELGKTLAPTYLRVRQAELGGQASEELLLAGLNQLKNPGAPLPVSEVTGSRIVRHKRDDTLILQSSFLVRDELMQLEFPLREDRE